MSSDAPDSSLRRHGRSPVPRMADPVATRGNRRPAAPGRGTVIAVSVEAADGKARPGARSARRASAGLSADVVDAHGHRVRTAPGLATWLREIAPSRIHGRVTVALVSNATMRLLNQSYRGADYATDVLSFPADAPVGQERRRSRVRRSGTAAAARGAATGVFLGDIVIAKGVAARQAHERGHSLNTELRILALHGLLHVAGFDHEQDRGEMAALERRLRRKGGLREGLIEREVAR